MESRRAIGVEYQVKEQLTVRLAGLTRPCTSHEPEPTSCTDGTFAQAEANSSVFTHPYIHDVQQISIIRCFSWPSYNQL